MNKIQIDHSPERYENIFNMYEFGDSKDNTYIFYNILSKITIPDNLDNTVFEYYVIDSEMPLTTLSYKLYRTQHLWWLIMIVNNIKNPVKLINSGSILKIIKPEFLGAVYSSIKQKI